ncbi:MAG TPA: HAMP domain-containing sensor histidine kinase [Candidatus Angelobacter sp.]|jgi:signal transduction histidine kinase|nr:HAMP domain-containing sensor histidine kinase [Candidatus Angelobacter sp.]
MTSDSARISSPGPTSVEKRNKRPPPADQERGVAAALAHEINNPLEALLNLLYLIDRDATLTKEGRHYLALAGEEARRISQISHAAMNELGGTALPEDTDVPELLRSVLDFYKSRFESHGVVVNTSYCPNGNLSVYPQQLRQTFTNLLLNAAEATPEGGRIYARISVAHEWRGNKRCGLRLTVADSGCGIAATDLPRIWDPFYTTKGATGTGIGLPLVKNTVQKHDGVLRVRSSTKPGRSGTVFTIFLPTDGSVRVSKSA